jgi:alkylated DNA repair dioxygenase AlkB
VIEHKTKKKMTQQRVSIEEISGLQYLPNFINEQEAKQLIDFIDSQQWISHEMTDTNSMKRLTQQYGYTYNFATKTLRTNESEYIPFPKELHFLLERIQPLYGETPIQNMIINEYIASQGITRHLDRTDYFGDTVVSLSLLQAVPFNFYEFEHVDWNKIIGIRNLNQHTKRKLTGREASVMLAPNSLLVLSGESRYDWQHEIPKNNPILYSDIGTELYSTDSKWFRRDQDYRRVSLTFRSVLPEQLQQ